MASGAREPPSVRTEPLARRVLTQELLGQLRRDLAEQRQAHVAAQGLLQLGAGRRVVASHEHDAADLELARQGARAVDGGRRARPPAARVEHQDDRRVEAARQVGGPRTVHALPLVEQRTHAR